LQTLLDALKREKGDLDIEVSTALGTKNHNVSIVADKDKIAEEFIAADDTE